MPEINATTDVRLLSFKSCIQSANYGTHSIEFEEQTAQAVQKEKIWWKKYLGLLLASLMGFCFFVNSTAAKKLEHKSPADLVFLFALGGVVFNLPSFTKNCVDFKLSRRELMFLIAGSICTAIGLMSRFKAVKLLPIGESSAILFNTPIVTSILARIFLQEEISRITAISIVISAVGMCLVVQLPTMIIVAVQGTGSEFGSLEHSIGCGYALVSLITYSVLFVILRRLKNVNPLTLTTAYGITNLICVTCLLPAFNNKPFLTLGGECTANAGFLVVLGIMGPIITWCNGAAFHYEQASLITIVTMSVDIVFCFLGQVFIFQEPINAYNCSGAGLVVLSGFFVTFQKWVLTNPADSVIRQKFKWIEK